MHLIKETPWETRNLGLPAYQLSSEGLDDKAFARVVREDLAALSVTGDLFFVFARLHAAESIKMRVLEQAGFRLIEGTLQPWSKLSGNPLFQRFLDDPAAILPSGVSAQEIEVKLLDQHEADFAQAERIREIARHSFTADRFHMDPFCGGEKAGQRFAYWVDDLISREGVDFDLLRVRSVIAGFMARRADELILAGFAPEFIGARLGSYLWFSACERVRQAGFDEVHTTISTNNMPVMNLYAKLGFRFRNPMYSFHYWHLNQHGI